MTNGNGSQRYQAGADEAQEQQAFQKSMTQSQPQCANAPSVCYHLAHRMKLAQIRLWPHCQTTNDANHRKNARTQTNHSKPNKTTNLEQTTDTDSKRNAKTKTPDKQKNEREQIQAICENSKKRMPNEKKKTQPYNNKHKQHIKHKKQKNKKNKKEKKKNEEEEEE